MRACFYYSTLFLALGSLLETGCSRLAADHSSETNRRASYLSADIDGTLIANPDQEAEAELDRRVRAHAHYATALSYDLNNEPELALKEYYEAALLDPAYEPLVLETARRLLRAKEPSKAIELLSKTAALPSASGNVFAFLGLAHAQLGKTDLAIAANKTAIKRMPQSLIPYQNLAHIYLQNHQTDEALKVLDQASQLEDVDMAFLLDLVELYFRYSRFQNTRSPEITDRIRKLLARADALQGDNPLLLQKLGDAYFQIGEFSKSEKAYLELIKIHPDLPSLRGKLFEIYLRSGDRAKAAEQLKALARDDPTNPQTYYFLGAIALDDQEPEKAAEYFERTLLLNPEMEQVYYDLAILKLNLRKPEEAKALLDKARSKFKLNFQLEFYTGVVLGALKNYSEAIKHFISAELLAKTTDPDSLNDRFYFHIGSAYERDRQYDEAERYFRKALELAPENAEALNYLGYMWAELGVKLDEAKALIEKAVELEPENAAFLDSLAWVLYKMNQPKEALAWQLKAIQHAEEADPTLYDHLGDIYHTLNQPEQAQEAWRKSLSVEPNEEVERKLQSSISNRSKATR